MGGFLGSISRYLTGLFFVRFWPDVFSLGTFIANILGCFLIGLFVGLAQKNESLNPAWKMFFVVGFCGGYTTFSSFSLENLQFLQKAQYINFGIYAFSSLILGLLAVVAGFLFAKILNI